MTMTKEQLRELTKDLPVADPQRMAKLLKIQLQARTLGEKVGEVLRGPSMLKWRFFDWALKLGRRLGL